MQRRQRKSRRVRSRLDAALPSLQSSCIEVEYYELTLLLPLFVQARKNNRGTFADDQFAPNNSDFLGHWAKYLCTVGNWQAETEEYPRKPPHLDTEPSYSEFCYFHPFVRNFLFTTRGDIRDHAKRASTAGEASQTAVATNRNLHILRRTDLSSLAVELPHLASELEIKSCAMYLFDTQIAMLEVQLQFTSSESKPPLSLASVLDLQDSIRRVYSPYWGISPDSKRQATLHEDERVPTRLVLNFDPTNSNNREPLECSYGNYVTKEAKVEQVRSHPGAPLSDVPAASTDAVNEHLDFVRTHREPYTVGVWAELLKPLQPVQIGSTDGQPTSPCYPELTFEHIQDERATTMSFIGVSDHKVRRISDGDWLRLAAVDDKGDSRTFPYSPTFFSDSESPIAEFAYDRFWHPTGYPPAQDFQQVRWLCSGYGFSGVGNASNDFFMDSHAGALCHFRRHYFAICMIAHFHRASLLVYKHRLAEASDAMLTDTKKRFGTDSQDRIRDVDFRCDAEALVKELLRFRTLYWFSEVSNQVQGKELFEMFRQHLRLEPLFSEITVDVEAAVSLLRQWDSEEQARATQQLAMLGTLLLVLGPMLGSLSSFVEGHQLQGLLSACIALTGLVWTFQRCPSTWLRQDGHSKWRRRIARPLRSFVLWHSGLHLTLSLLLVAVGTVGVYRSWSPSLLTPLTEERLVPIISEHIESPFTDAKNEVIKQFENQLKVQSDVLEEIKRSSHPPLRPLDD